MTEHKKFAAVLNGYTYVISKVNRRDAKYLVGISKRYGLYECISKYLKEKDWNYLTNICISENDIGLHLMGMICFYEISVIKTSGYRRAPIEDIKKRINKVKKYHDYEFLKDDAKQYKLFLLSLNKDELEKESLIVKQIQRKINLLERYCFRTISELKISIEATLRKARVNENDVYDYITKLFNLYLNIKDKIADLHIENSNKNIKANILDIDSLMNSYVQFHTRDKKSITDTKEEIKKVFDLFNSRLFVKKHPISLDRYGVINNISEAVVGNKKNGKWDYRSVLIKLVRQKVIQHLVFVLK